MAVTLDHDIAVADITAGNLGFVPDPDANGAGYASFQFQVNDGTDYSAAATLTVDVTPVSDAPTNSDNIVTTLENTAYAFTVADFNFADVDASDTLIKVRITQLPFAGSLELNGTAVTINQEITVADIAAGNLGFVPDPDASGTDFASFQFEAVLYAVMVTSK